MIFLMFTGTLQPNLRNAFSLKPDFNRLVHAKGSPPKYQNTKYASSLKRSSLNLLTFVTNF
jgi:hypothetical protein